MKPLICTARGPTTTTTATTTDAITTATTTATTTTVRVRTRREPVRCHTRRKDLSSTVSLHTQTWLCKKKKQRCCKSRGRTPRKPLSCTVRGPTTTTTATTTDAVTTATTTTTNTTVRVHTRRKPLSA